MATEHLTLTQFAAFINALPDGAVKAHYVQVLHDVGSANIALHGIDVDLAEANAMVGDTIHEQAAVADAINKATADTKQKSKMGFWYAIAAAAIILAIIALWRITRR